VRSSQGAGCLRRTRGRTGPERWSVVAVSDVQEVLPRGGWLGSMPRDARQKLLTLARRETYDSGAEVAREGEPATRLGIVLSGRLALQLYVPERGRVTVETAEPGDVVGLSSIVPPHRSTMTAVAEVPVELLAVDADTLRRAVAEDCELGASIYSAVARALSRRLEATYNMLLDLFAGPQASPF
jgi:CRP/FNR family cyclic AMP-dependent transcriptional regulator